MILVVLDCSSLLFHCCKDAVRVSPWVTEQNTDLRKLTRIRMHYHPDWNLFYGN